MSTRRRVRKVSPSFSEFPGVFSRLVARGLLASIISLLPSLYLLRSADTPTRPNPMPLPCSSSYLSRALFWPHQVLYPKRISNLVSLLTGTYSSSSCSAGPRPHVNTVHATRARDTKRARSTDTGCRREGRQRFPLTSRSSFLVGEVPGVVSGAQSRFPSTRDRRLLCLSLKSMVHVTTAQMVTSAPSLWLY